MEENQDRFIYECLSWQSKSTLLYATLIWQKKTIKEWGNIFNFNLFQTP
jgi:hypothetical protein